MTYRINVIKTCCIGYAEHLFGPASVLLLQKTRLVKAFAALLSARKKIKLENKLM
jgi:hypothetical protein